MKELEERIKQRILINEEKRDRLLHSEIPDGTSLPDGIIMMELKNNAVQSVCAVLYELQCLLNDE